MIKRLVDVHISSKCPIKISPCNSVFWNHIHHIANIEQKNIAPVPLSGTNLIYAFLYAVHMTVAFSNASLEVGMDDEAIP